MRMASKSGFRFSAGKLRSVVATPWRPEAIGWHDVMATLNELAMAAIVAGMLGILPLPEERLARATRYVAVPLLVISVLAASLAHHH